MTRRAAPLIILVLALGVLTWSIVWIATPDRDGQFGMMRFGSGMMGYGASGPAEPVHDLAGAKRQAARFADGLDLDVGEVMRFENHYYAEITERDGQGATEVLVDPGTGTVVLEPGPAMMWNTRFGMMGRSGMMGSNPMMDYGGGGSGSGGMMGGSAMVGPSAAAPGEPQSRGEESVSAAKARTIAARWIRDRNPGATVGEPDAFPGYFTLHTLREGKIEGMLSVNAYTGAVWYHSWHGRFVEMVE